MGAVTLHIGLCSEFCGPVYSKWMVSAMRFFDRICYFRDATEDKEGNLHSEANGQFVGKSESNESQDQKKEGTEVKEKFDKVKFDELAGEEFKGVRGHDAIMLLMQKKKGHVKKAFSRQDIGDIDLLWGDENVGLCHILRRRSESKGVNIEDFVNSLTDTITNGKLYFDNTTGNFEIWKNKQMVVVSREFFGKEMRLVITAFPSSRMPSRFKNQGLRDSRPAD